jgi:hypothetical protein
MRNASHKAFRACHDQKLLDATVYSGDFVAANNQVMARGMRLSILMHLCVTKECMVNASDGRPALTAFKQLRKELPALGPTSC